MKKLYNRNKELEGFLKDKLKPDLTEEETKTNDLNFENIVKEKEDELIKEI
jgi:hypothetical protein